jgi:hypothetical protein
MNNTRDLISSSDNNKYFACTANRNVFIFALLLPSLHPVIEGGDVFGHEEMETLFLYSFD